MAGGTAGLKPMSQGPVIIVSGPSGCGKSTVIGRLLARGDLPARLSVSVTTREPRPGEVDGVHYHFWTRERFERERQAGHFLEWAGVHGHYYGTLRQEVEPYLARGMAVLLDVDVQGAEQLRRIYPGAVAVFLRAPTWEAYEERLRARGTEGPAAVARRLATARRELERAGEYDVQVVNDDLGAAVNRLHEVVEQALTGDSDAG